MRLKQLFANKSFAEYLGAAMIASGLLMGGASGVAVLGIKEAQTLQDVRNPDYYRTVAQYARPSTTIRSEDIVQAYNAQQNARAQILAGYAWQFPFWSCVFGGVMAMNGRLERKARIKNTPNKSPVPNRG